MKSRTSTRIVCEMGWSKFGIGMVWWGRSVLLTPSSMDGRAAERIPSVAPPCVELSWTGNSCAEFWAYVGS